MPVTAEPEAAGVVGRLLWNCRESVHAESEESSSSDPDSSSGGSSSTDKIGGE